jgi:hypothetical protein
MPRRLDQSDAGVRSDRQAALRILFRATENTTRPKARNKRIIALARELLEHLQKDALEGSGAQA